MKTKKLLEYPIKTATIYLLFTILLFLIGPIRFNIPSYTKTVIVLLIYTLSFTAGYCYQMHKKLNKNTVMLDDLSDPNNGTFGLLKNLPFNKISFIFVISCLYSIVRNAIFTIHFYGSIDFSKLFTIDLGEAYFDRLDSGVVGRWYILLLDLLYVLDLFWYIIGIIYYKKLDVRYKTLFFITIAFNLLYVVMGGTSIAWAVFVFRIIPFFFLERQKAQFANNKKMKLKSKRNTLIIIILCLLFLALFNSLLQARNSVLGAVSGNLYDKGDLSPYIDKEINLPIFGDAIKHINFYLCNGYVGFSYALELPPEFTYGLGFSRDFARTINQYFGFDVSSFIYPQRVEEAFGWLNGKWWPSAYTWFASDITFYGLPLFMFVFGIFFCNVWYSALYENSIVAVTLSSWLWIGIIFIPANNQLFQSFGMFMGTVVLIVLYFLRKKLPRITW